MAPQLETPVPHDDNGLKERKSVPDEEPEETQECSKKRGEQAKEHKEEADPSEMVETGKQDIVEEPDRFPHENKDKAKKQGRQEPPTKLKSTTDESEKQTQEPLQRYNNQ